MMFAQDQGENPLKLVFVSKGGRPEIYDTLQNMRALLSVHLAGLQSLAVHFEPPLDPPEVYYATHSPELRIVSDEEQEIIQQRLKASLDINTLFNKIEYGQIVDPVVLRAKLDTLCHWIDTHPADMQYDTGYEKSRNLAEFVHQFQRAIDTAAQAGFFKTTATNLKL